MILLRNVSKELLIGAAFGVGQESERAMLGLSPDFNSYHKWHRIQGVLEWLAQKSGTSQREIDMLKLEGRHRGRRAANHEKDPNFIY